MKKLLPLIIIFLINISAFGQSLYIGQSYQGGIIFYLDSSGQQGLIAAPFDQADTIPWNNNGFDTLTGANGQAIGTGDANTTIIVNTQGNGHYAAKICDQLNLNGYHDWFLPSIDELTILYQKRNIVGGFVTVHTGGLYYWSSSETGVGGAYAYNFEYNFPQSIYKNVHLPLVRAIRKICTPPAATITPLSSTTFCQGGSVVLNANLGAGLSYKWKLNNVNIPGATNPSYTTSVAGNYTVLVTTAGGCTAKSAITKVTVNSIPVATITPNSSTTFCGNGNVVLISNAASSYQWYKNNSLITGATFQTFTATTTGQYSVRITNATSCTGSSSQIQVTKYSLPIITFTTSGSTTFCNGDSVVISSTTNATSPAFQWLKNSALINGATNSVYTAKTAGKYQVQITNTTTGCISNSSKVSVTVNCKMNNNALIENQFTVFPNPTTSSVNISFTSHSITKGSIVIYNTLNEIIYNNSFAIFEGVNNQVINLKDNAKGIYFVQLRMDNEIYYQKLVIE